MVDRRRSRVSLSPFSSNDPATPRNKNLVQSKHEAFSSDPSRDLVRGGVVVPVGLGRRRSSRLKLDAMQTHGASDDPHGPDASGSVSVSASVGNTFGQREQRTLLPSWYVVQLTATASLGGCLFGYDMGAISGTLPQLTTTFDLNDNQKELVVSILYVGGAFGACIGGSLCDRIGRKVTIMVTDFIFVFGALWLYLAPSYAAVVAGRFVVGVGVAVSGVADVTYLRECAPIEWRGAIVSVNEACISLGFLLAYIAGYVYADEGAGEWRIVFGVAGILAVVQLVGMLKLPESPAWLAEKGRDEEARRALALINGSTDDSFVTGGRGGGDLLPSFGWGSRVYDGTCWSYLWGSDRSRRGRHRNANEGGGIERADSHSPLREKHMIDADEGVLHEPGVSETNNSGSKTIGNREGDEGRLPLGYRDDNWHSVFTSWFRKPGYNLQSTALTISRYRQQTYIALFLAAGQQFCGQTNILNYAPLIFAEAMKNDFQNNGGNDNDQTEDTKDMSMVIIGVVKFFVTVLVIWRIEYIGRRSLLIIGNGLIALGLLALVVAFGGSNNAGNGDDGASSWSPMINIKTFDLALPGVLLVVSGYSMSFGPLTWLLTSEIFPTEIRGRALGCSSIITSMCGALSTQTFLLAQSLLGPSFVFGIYCVITVAGALFAYLAIPDTGGKTVEQIDESLKQMHWWKYSSMVVSQDDRDGGPESHAHPETARSVSLEFSGHNLT
mmetsp:Transcript_24681/g.68146  ORF Transcript_24681/g.68146 Transcript_24681/m.68146 type:complete len:724 (+) Transcript_24681:227-2398(+)